MMQTATLLEHLAPLRPVPVHTPDGDSILMTQVAHSAVTYRDCYAMFFEQPDGKIRQILIDGRELDDFLRWMDNEIQRHSGWAGALWGSFRVPRDISVDDLRGLMVCAWLNEKLEAAE